MKAIGMILVVGMAVGLSGCWYRQCSIKGCKVRYNHSHGGSIVRGRGTFPKPYFFGKPRTTAEKREQANEKRRKRG
ncbi:hypothetical protein [Runella sp.]|jgi:hypothetical protein|uniref:hypothetical protein n=1 Tax=Runella sp. TaxID=1960881 RepID=UPI00260DBAF9|nr:hypothetical protein [Runella sp.]